MESYGWEEKCVLDKGIRIIYIKSLEKKGPVAQLGARLNGIQKVRGSNPLRSTKRKPKTKIRNPKI
jgi:hypothetical protein